ncbi:MAG: hypothetical protein AB1705_17730 [Verrucomicrobiota bacterium]
MKFPQLFNLTGALLLTTLALNAQPGGMGGPRGPRMDGGMLKLFGEHKAFSSDIDVMAPMPGGQSVMLVGKIAILDGKSRFEIDMSKAKGGGLPPGAAEQMKAMGMAEIITISRPDKKVSFMVYPGLKGYVEQTMPEDALRDADSFKLETTAMGKETIDGHPCEKMKFTVADNQGHTREGLVWQATDLKKFPIQFQMKENGQDITMTFKNVKLEKPEAAQLEAPAGFTKYDSMQAMIQDAMQKRFGGAGGFPKQQ